MQYGHVVVLAGGGHSPDSSLHLPPPSDFNYEAANTGLDTGVAGSEVVRSRMAVDAEAAVMAPAAEPQVIYVNTEDGEPYALESLCMSCHETVSYAGWGCSCPRT